MKSSRTIRKQFPAWIAIFAILCQTLLPMVVQARMQQSPGLTLELCTSSGTRQVVLKSDSALPMSKVHTQHCQFCLSGGFVAFEMAETAHLHTPPPALSSYLLRQNPLQHVTRNHVSAAPRGPPASF